MDALLIPFWTGFIAQLLANLLGRGQGMITIALLLLSGMSPLLSLFCAHASTLTHYTLASLLHARLGSTVQAPRSTLLWPALLGATLALLPLWWLDVSTQRVVLLSVIIMLGAGLLLQRQATRGPLSVLCAGALAALSGSHGVLREASGRAVGAASLAILLISMQTVLITACALGPESLSLSPLPVLGLLAGAVLAAPWGPWLWTSRSRLPEQVHADY